MQHRDGPRSDAGRPCLTLASVEVSIGGSGLWEHVQAKDGKRQGVVALIGPVFKIL